MPDYPCAALFLDLDRRKVIDDSISNMVGNVVLIEMTRRLERFRMRDDTEGRPV